MTRTAQQAEQNYIYVDVDSEVVSVYDELQTFSRKTFITSPELRESRSDVLCKSEAEAKQKAREFAAATAKKIGCAWGDNS
jgi:hypothetical protein